jgi:hypothetical protein
MPTILYTSLSEIRSFNPCLEGWKDIISAHRPVGEIHTPEEMDALFPLVDCLNSNSISDVCWLLGKRKKEIQVCVKFAKMCADSVQHLKKQSSSDASDAASDAAYASVAASDVASAVASDAYASAEDYAAYAAYSATVAYAEAYAASAYDAKQEQINKNIQFLRQCIQAYEQEN